MSVVQGACGLDHDTWRIDMITCKDQIRFVVWVWEIEARHYTAAVAEHACRDLGTLHGFDRSVRPSDQLRYG